MRHPCIGVVLVVSPRGTNEDPRIYQQLCRGGLTVQSASGVRAALRQLETSRPQVVVLGPGATDDGDNLDALACVRRSAFDGMILVVGRAANSDAAVAALERGADDYVAVSCDATELIARVRALARRAAGPRSLERDAGGLLLDLRHSVARSNSGEVALTRREADLLDYLARNAGHPVTREEIAVHIWHTSRSTSGTNIVDVYVSYLRRKLATIGRQSAIRSVRGVGYEWRNGE